MIAYLALLVATHREPSRAYASRTEQVYKLSSPKRATVSLDGTNGHIRVCYGRADRIDVKVLVRADTAGKLSETSETLERFDNSFTLKQEDAFKPSDRPNGRYENYDPPIIDVTIAVPAETELAINTYNADVSVKGVFGNAFVKSYNGRISYEYQAGHPKPVYCSSRNGKVTSEPLVSTNSASPIHLETYNGDIVVTATDPPKHLVGGYFFDRRRFVSTDWFIVDGRLSKTPPSVPTARVDLQGRFVAPAYGDAHTHHFEGEYFSRLMAGKYLSEGTLFAQSMTEHISMKAGANKVVNQPDSMDVAFADAGFTATNGHPTFTYELLAAKLPANLTPQERSDRLKGSRSQEGDAYWIVDTPDDLEHVWPRFLASDPDLVKVFLVDSANRFKNIHGFMGSIGLDPAILPLIVHRAHEAGLRVYAHIDTVADFKIALEAGVDGLAHMPGYGFNEGPSESVDLTPQMAQLAGGHYIQLTAGLTAGYAGKNLRRTQTLQARNIQALRRAGAIPVIGSDTYGSTSALDVDAWRQLGQTPLQILTALSRDTPQSIFPWRSIGEISEGYEADLVILRRDPLEDPSTMMRADQVLKGSRVIFEAPKPKD